MPTYYLNADTGNDTTGDGSSGNPWKTIGKADTAASDGDTIILQAATAAYAHTGVQTFTKDLTFQGADRENVTVTATRQWATTSRTITFEDMLIQLDNDGGNYAFIFNGAGLTFNRVTFDLVIKGGNTTYAFLYTTAGGGAFYNFNNCVFLAPKRRTGEAKANSILFRRAANSATLSLIGCLFYFDDPSNEEIETAISWGPTDVTIKNCIFSNASGEAIILGSASFVSSYNCYYQMTTYPSGTGDITSDPLLVDPSNGNFNLRPTSPCIGTGVDL